MASKENASHLCTTCGAKLIEAFRQANIKFCGFCLKAAEQKKDIKPARYSFQKWRKK